MGKQVLAVTCEDGSCSVWAWEGGQCIMRLELPSDMKRGSFSRARWARDGSLGLYAAVTTAGEGYPSPSPFASTLSPAFFINLILSNPLVRGSALGCGCIGLM
jgi:hypothetical protein